VAAGGCARGRGRVALFAYAGRAWRPGVLLGLEGLFDA